MFSFINGRLSIGIRLALVACIFIASAAVSAFIQYARGKENTDFSRKELAGSAYIAAVWQSLQSGTPFSGQDGAQFASRDAAAAFAAAQGWDNRVASASGLILAAADGSNLTLDPDLDSYYAMDAATVKLPNLLNMSLALDKAVALPRSGADRRLKLAMALDRFSNAADAAFASLDASMKNNAAGLTLQALQTYRSALQASTAAMIKAAQEGTPSGYAAASAPFSAILDKSWRATNGELARLLEVRIAGQVKTLITDLAVVLALLLVSTLLTGIVTFGLSRRFKGLDAAMTGLNRGDKTVIVPYLSDRNETGRIAATLETLKQSMIGREAAEEKAQARNVELVISSFGSGLAALAGRDLSKRLDQPLPAGYRQLQSDYNAAMEELSQALGDVSRRSNDIAAKAGEISSAADQTAQRTERQAGALEQTSASMKQITDAVGTAAARAAEAHAAAATAKNRAEHGSSVAAKAVQAMDSIAKSSGEISQIIGVIDEIAFQTNLLSLNANVEAARVGEAGQGFAVVAGEVRALAQRSADSAKQIKQLIKTSETQVQSGVTLVEQSGAELASIVEDIARITAFMNEIAESGKQQANTLGEVNLAIGEIDQATQQSAAMVEESTAASKALAEITHDLAKLVGRFRLGSGPRSGSGPPAPMPAQTAA
jgi:methyl-accepting chemotaxis protein